ncbi:TetR/AcrR family transcriptional regulator [Brevibacterium renqingii]|uniref:TetR/AcrR family transcriptional regulator n=1 Tax=Brevibacterium renqingii TaxID=2776916 RepID=UPI0031B5A3A5
MSEAAGMRRLGREALLRESLSVLAENSQASMLEIARVIGVGRTTLYRHFGDREALVAEAARLGARMFGAAVMDARPDVGSGLEAVERVCERLFTVPEVLTLMFADEPIITDDVFAEVGRESRAEPAGAESAEGAPAEGGPAERGGDDVLERIIARGQSDGSITNEVPLTWAAMYVFLTIGSGHLFGVVGEGSDSDPRRHGLELTLRAVRRTLAAEADD